MSDDWTGMPHRSCLAAILVLSALLSAACGGDEPTAAAASEEHAEHEGGAAAGSGSTSPGAAGSRSESAHNHGDLDLAESGVGSVLSGGDDGFGHLLREAPVGARPRVALRATADPAGGWTLQVVTSGFIWTPDEVNTPADAGAGHSHLYVAGTKIARTYGEWTFVPASVAQPGDALTAILYADDHTAWAVDGEPVSADVVLPTLPARAAL